MPTPALHPTKRKAPLARDPPPTAKLSRAERVTLRAQKIALAAAEKEKAEKEKALAAAEKEKAAKKAAINKAMEEALEKERVEYDAWLKADKQAGARAK